MDLIQSPRHGILDGTDLSALIDTTCDLEQHPYWLDFVWDVRRICPDEGLAELELWALLTDDYDEDHIIFEWERAAEREFDPRHDSSLINLAAALRKNGAVILPRTKVQVDRATMAHREERIAAAICEWKKIRLADLAAPDTPENERAHMRSIRAWSTKFGDVKDEACNRINKEFNP